MSLIFEVLNILIAVQAAQATVVGTVRDEQTGEPLASAVVAMPDLNRITTTDEGGRYMFLDVPPGPQHITVRFIGHAQRALHALVPPSGQLEINLSLRTEPVHLHTIEVRHRVAIRGLEDEDSSGSFDRRSSIAAIRNHPLLSEPDVLQALEGGPAVLQQESPSGVHIRGGSTDHTAYLLDGVPVFSPYHAAGLFSALNPDALSGVHLSASVPMPGYPDALAGTIAATTREPGTSMGMQGTLSTTQARMTIDGGIGPSGAGYLVSLRSRMSSLPAQDRDPTYLQAESGDLLAKLEAPVGGGRIRLLGYDSGNEIDASAQPNAPRDARRNSFEWTSRSFGAEWSGQISGTGFKLLGWRATGDAASAWAGSAGNTTLAAARHDLGLLGTVEVSSEFARTTAGIRLERSRTFYQVNSDSTPAGWTMRANTPVATAFAQHTRALGRQAALTVGASMAAADADLHFGPYGQLRLRLAERLTLSGSYARRHQFAQSLRNAESVVGNIFPADLYLGAGAPGVPAGRSDGVVVGAEYTPFTGARLAVEAYRRTSDGLLLVAPRDGGPFTTGAFAVGSGTSTGLAVDAALSGARYGIVASYGLQGVRLRHGESGYVPGHGTTHLLQGGVIVFPSATTSIRLGATSALGRRTTALSGGLEWEACNLLDRGCEFAGSPDNGSEAIGAIQLPGYLRVDLGLRKHWHFQLAGRDAMVGFFATVTNLLDRKNVLTYTEDPTTGERLPIEMRPLAPLVVGLDWRF
jgi:carboxypeptidase family protein